VSGRDERVPYFVTCPSAVGGSKVRSAYAATIQPSRRRTVGYRVDQPSGRLLSHAFSGSEQVWPHSFKSEHWSSEVVTHETPIPTMAARLI